MLRRIILTAMAITVGLVGYGQKNKKEEPTKWNQEKPDTLSGLTFRAIGPAMTSGRISDIAVDPSNKNVWFIASSSGGVWKTSNAGTTWEPVFDKEGSYSIGCVTIDPSNHNNIWIGTGENNSQRSVAYGDGIYKSTDGGKSFTNMGLKNSEHIGNIIVHPTNSQIIYVAAYGPLWSPGGDRGVYKSADGGKTWERLLYISENTGINEIRMDPRDPNILYAAAHQRRRHVFTYISGGPESAIYKSIDGGSTWHKIIKGLPEVDLGRIGMDISPVNPDFLFAIIEAANDKGGFFKSTDRGESWVKMSDYTTSGNYYQEIFCDPVDIDRVYCMDTWLQVTDDSGKNFSRLGEKFKHVDNHAMWIDPVDVNHYLVGCDGGLYESFDRGENWDFFGNLPITQFYKVSVDNDYPFYNVYGGTQDNFSLGGPSRTTNTAGITNADWYITNGGDGFESVVDPENPDIVYAQSQYGFLVRYDRKSGEIIDIKPLEREGEAAYRWNWDAPLLISPHQSTRLYFAANKVFRSDDRGNTWKVISDDLTQQIDRNKIPVMGRIWSVDAVAKNESTTIYGNIVSLDESPMKEDLLYAGTDDGLVNVTEDAGGSWKRLSSFPGVPKNTYVNCLLASIHDENRVYAAFNNHKNGDFKPYLLVSNDKGTSWTSIAGNLPARGSVYSIAEDHVNPSLLFAGTEFGIFFSTDSGKSWVQLKGGIPTIAIRDISIQKRENDLVLASFGRGFYILDDYSPLRNYSASLLDKNAHIFPVKDSWMYIASQPLGLREKSFQGSSYFTAENPPIGAVFTYYLKEDIKSLKEIREDKEKEIIKQGGTLSYPTFDEMRAEDDELKPMLIFTIRDQEGNIIRKLENEPKKGFHRIHWDFRYPSSSPIEIKKQEFENIFANLDVGPLAMPGTYTVSMEKFHHGIVTELVPPIPFKTSLLSNTTLPAEDSEAVFQFQEEVAELMRVIDGTNETLRDLTRNMEYIQKGIKNTAGISGEMAGKVAALEMELKEADRQLNGDGSLSGREFETPPSVSGRVGTIVSGLWFSTSAPTQTQKKSLQIAEDAFEKIYLNLKDDIIPRMKDIESELERSGTPYTPGRLPEWKK